MKLIEFLIKAKVNTYADGIKYKVPSTKPNSIDYHYEEDDYVYHDTYFGGTRFMGEEVVYCNIVDACISCVRLILLLVVSELCYIHMRSIMLFETALSVQLILYAVIIALLIWFTAVRLSSLSEIAERESESEKPRQIIEN